MNQAGGNIERAVPRRLLERPTLAPSIAVDARRSFRGPWPFPPSATGSATAAPLPTDTAHSDPLIRRARSRLYQSGENSQTWRDTGGRKEKETGGADRFEDHLPVIKSN